MYKLDVNEMTKAALEALLREQLESDRQDEEALKALGQAEASKRDEAQKTLSRQLLVKTSTRNITEEHADDYKLQDDDGMQGDKPQDDDGIQDDEAQEDKLQEDEDAHYPMFQKDSDSDVHDNSGVVLSNPNPRSVVHRPATPPGFNSANRNASCELVDMVAAISPPVGGMPLMAKTAIVDKNNGGGKQSAISWEKGIVVARLNFAGKTFRVKQEGQETTCHAVLLVEHKPAVALNYLYDHHFGNALFVNGLTSLWL
jgi:hypothetical protein